MKKNYFLATCLFITTFTFAQNRDAKIISSPSKFKIPQSISNRGNAVIDTIFDNLEGDSLANYTLGGPNSGYLAGHNSFSDKAKIQRFDPTHGVNGPGSISELLFFFFAKEGDPTGTMKATIYADNNGLPGAILGEQSFTFADVEIDDFTSVLFTSPVTVPSNQIFYAGVQLNYTSTGRAGLLTSLDRVSGDAPGLTGSFPDAITHTFEQASNNAYFSFATSWGLDIALAIFPVVQRSTGINSIKSDVISSVKNYPNPFTESTTISFDLKKSAKNVIVSVSDITGRIVFEKNLGSQNSGVNTTIIDGSTFSSGVYNCVINADGSKVTSRMMVE